MHRTLALISMLVTGVCAAQEAGTVASDAQAAPEVFAVLEYRVLGAARLQVREVERAVYPHLGPSKSVADIEQARVALELAYRNAGFGTVFVDLPEQDVNEGVVRLRVTEGKLDRIRVSGARYFSAGQIRESLPSVSRGAVPDLPALQSELATLNRATRDRAVIPVLKAGRTPGTVDLELKVDDHLPLHGSFDVNNRYTSDTSELRAGVQLSYDNLFQARHSLSLQFQTAPKEPDESRVYAATYVLPWGDSGRSLAFYAVDTDSTVAALGALSVLGAGRIYGARFIQPAPTVRALYQSFSAGVDYKDFKEDIRLDEETGLSTPISYLHWSLAYQGGIRSDYSNRTFSLTAGFGSRRLASSYQEFADRRFLGSPSYVYLRGTFDYERRLPADFGLKLKLAGQFTPRPLVPNEQFSIGGADSVRGYLESAALGDYGFAGTFELRSPPLLRWLGENAPLVQLLAFYDAGVVRIQEPIRDLDGHITQTTAFDLASYGVGLRASGSGFEASLDYASPLVPSGRTLDGDSRIHFGVRYGF